VTGYKRKLIEVALPLEAINRACQHEKSVPRKGHPATMHLWWARRPLAACRAVLFAQLVDDPSAHPDRFPTEEAQAVERRRLFDLLERLVVWENAGNEALLRQAHEEIALSFDGDPPPVLDPFAGGGSIPLEAQRLGLEAHASDLNPVAVLINKALIEIPPRWAGQLPVFPGVADSRLGEWPRASGLAEDVRRYGTWMRDEAEKRIGHLYTRTALPDGSAATVIAWLWARTVTCPNPACGATLPLVSNLWLSKKKGRPTWLRPLVNGTDVTFEVVVDSSGPPDSPKQGRGAKFACLVCGDVTTDAYVKAEGMAGRMGQQLLATVAEGQRQRVYLSPTRAAAQMAEVARPDDAPEAEMPANPRWFSPPIYGMSSYADLFTARQLTALTTFSDLVGEVRKTVESDARNADIADPEQYAADIATYLSFAVSKLADWSSSICSWIPQIEGLTHTFSKQAIPMTWDFTEVNVFSSSAGNFLNHVEWVAATPEALVPNRPGTAGQSASTAVMFDRTSVVATDPPYYDNIGYSDLSDFFYVWLRRSLRDVHPDLLSTLLTPKADELIASPYRFEGSKARAEEHFETGFVRTFQRIRESHPTDVPITVFYAFKQAESDDGGLASTGWETMLNGLIEAGLTVTATWPMRTERSARSIGIGTNALASSIVLACRPREATAEATTRRGFLQSLKDELPTALREMQQGSVAPVDLAQAAIGPGMAVFTRYRTVVEADGSAMTVRTALALINQVLDEVLSEQEGDFDADTRFCVKWFSQFGWEEAESGTADTLSRATNTSVAGLDRGGVFRARAGRARLVPPEEMTIGWDPLADERVSVWEVVVRLARTLDEGGAEEAAQLMAGAGQRVDLDAAKELAYLLYSICEKRRWTQTALLFNGLGTSWSDLSAAARVGGALTPPPAQGALDFDDSEA
jgi:putative DNA methylase